MRGTKAAKLRKMLEVAVEQGVLIFQDEKPATPEEVARVQCVNEEYTYLPDFIVKDKSGEIKEIWYAGTLGHIF